MQAKPGRTQTGYATKRLAPQGYKAITKPLAESMYNAGYPVTLCGNNVNSYHVFQGWYLGHTIQRSDIEERSYLVYSFADLLNNFMFYLERELGYYAVYYVKETDLQAYNQTRKGE